MGRVKQVFAAPDDGSGTLPIDPSPWHIGLFVYLPIEHWNALVSFAQKIDQDSANTLITLAKNENLYTDDIVTTTPEVLRSALRFVNQLQKKLETSNESLIVMNEELPEQFENSEYIRMLRAVSAVFNKSLRLNQPFRAWVE